MAVNVMFYSVKGGSGRSTATANVAVELARRGHRVLCIDLDFEGGGIRYLFDIKNQDAFCIQDYIEGYAFTLPARYKVYLTAEGTVHDELRAILNSNHVFLPSDATVSRMGNQGWLIDAGSCRCEVKDVNGQLKVYLEDKKFSDASCIEVEEVSGQTLQGKLRLLPSDSKIHTVTADETVLYKRVHGLIESCQHYDAILLDSPSGWGSISATAMALSDIVLIFFRFAKQHVYGTINYLKEERLIESNPDKWFMSVASCVPETSHRDQKNIYVSYYESFNKICAEIKEDEEQKWSERVVVLDKKVSKARAGYQKIADIIEERMHRAKEPEAR